MTNESLAETPAFNLQTREESLIHKPDAEAVDFEFCPDEAFTDDPLFPKLRPEITIRYEPDVADILLEKLEGNGD